MIINYRPTFVIIDGHNMFIRHYVVNPTMDTNGARIGGVAGTLRALRGLVERFKPTAVFFVWDGPNGSERRRSIRAEYKEGRRVRLNRGREGDADFSETAAEDLNNMDDQLELARKYLETLGIPQVRIPGVEADDTVSYLCSHIDGLKVVVSTDADLLQLVGDDVHVYNPAKDKVLKAADVLSERLCLPENYALMKAVCGDKGDNVAGVDGIGPKTLVKIVPELARTEMGLQDMLSLIEGRSTETDKKGRPTAIARRALEILAVRPHVEENLTLVSLRTPLMSAEAARSVRSLAASPPQYRAAGFRVEALRDGIQLREDFDRPFIMLAARTAIWAKKIRETDAQP